MLNEEMVSFLHYELQNIMISTKEKADKQLSPKYL